MLSRGGTLLLSPAGPDSFPGPPFPGDQEKELPFDIGRYPAPALLIAVNGLDRCAQKLGQFFLGFSETFSEGGEFGIFHGTGHKRRSIKNLV
jgi:hypothetical protein